MATVLPIGFFQFHKNQFFNLQFNRWYSEGFARFEDLQKAKHIKTFDDNKTFFSGLAEKALQENRLMNAASYFRAAEFLTDPGDPEKNNLYNRFQETFYKAFAEDNIQRFQIPYEGGFLSAMTLPMKGKKKGTVLVHGGFDSFIEEFYGIWKLISEGGYEVIAFEGPGQGEPLRKYNLPFDHAWEKPVAAILDFFHLEDVTILGISMGGYWCLRAAAFEKRIKKVIVFPPLLDWLESTGQGMRSLVEWMLKHEGLMRAQIKMKMKIPAMEHVIKHTLFIAQKNDVLDVVQWELAMNKEYLHSELVDQDVLLLASERDIFQPPVLYKKQWNALINAKSIKGRIFTDQDQASHHCAIGNMGIAVRAMLDWLDEFV
jgi:pimeloyl-ACP methyl ester carboxylesterase